MTRRGGALMSNHFFRVTSNGGYIGRFAWANKGSNGANKDGFGGWEFASDESARCYPEGFWAGSLWIIRILTR